MRTALRAALALSFAMPMLAACGGEAPAEAPADGPVGLAVSDAMLALPPVAGNPAAIYFSLENGTDRTAVVRRADVENAERAELHDVMEWEDEMTMTEMGQIAIPPGESLSFEPGGKHVMAFGLPETMAAGDMAEVTLTMVGGDKLSFPARAQAAGDER